MNRKLKLWVLALVSWSAVPAPGAEPAKVYVFGRPL